MFYRGVVGAQLQFTGVEVACTRCNRRSWTTLATPGRSECCHAEVSKTGRRAESIPKNGEFMPTTKSRTGTVPHVGAVYIGQSKLPDF